MGPFVLPLLDKAFFVFHTVLIGFNLVGWAWRRTRPLHLLTLSLTAASWFVLGAFYGWGYCPCTDWHLRVRRRLGYHDPESSYIQLLVGHVLGIPLSRAASDRLAMVVLGLIVAATAFAWARDRRRRYRHGR
jgi:hypothetical protein